MNKFVKFIKDNDIKNENEAYIMAVIICNPKDKSKSQYVWYKLLKIRNIEIDGEIKQQIYLLDYFDNDVEKSKQFTVGQLIHFDLTQKIGSKTKICNIYGVNANE